MATTDLEARDLVRSKSAASRLSHEAKLIAEARASAASGRIVSEAQVDAWVDSLGTDQELPPPRSTR
jgi:predicted transcriptional regulator